MTATSNPYRGFRYPADVIQHAEKCSTESSCLTAGSPMTASSNDTVTSPDLAP